MFNFNKKPHIKFYSLIPAVATLYPISPASQLKRKWKGEEKVAFEERQRTCPLHLRRGMTSVGRCPAISSSMNSGFILRAPADFTINTVGDLSEVNITARPVLNHVPYVDTHADWQTEWIVDHNKSFVVNKIIKINSPWRVLCNDPDIVFFVTQVQYWNESRFTQLDGILDPLITNELNCQLAWHVLDGTVTVDAGTPLAQYIPMSRKLLNSVDFSVEEADEKLYRLEQEMTYSGHHKFETDYKLKVQNMAKILKKYGY